MQALAIRHGETDWDREGRVSGQTDLHLNPEGLRQARVLSAYLYSQAFSEIWTSDLLSCVQTAKIIGNAKFHPIYETDLLREMSFGNLEGSLIEDVRTSKEWIDKGEHMYNLDPPGGETYYEVDKRVQLLLQRFDTATNPDQQPLFVTHETVLRVLWRLLNNTSSDEASEFEPGHFGVWKINFNAGLTSMKLLRRFDVATYL